MTNPFSLKGKVALVTGANTGLGQGIALAIECERLALGRDARIKHSDGASFSSHLGVKVYGNSHGFVKGYAASRNSLSCVLIGEQDGDMQRDYGYSSSRSLGGLWSPQRIADEAVERTVSRLGARKISTRHAPVLFHPDTAAGLWGHLVMAISGGNLYRKSSFLLDKLGKQILPEWLTIQEFPHLPGGLASTPFDGEGVRTRDMDIVRSGELMSWLLTSYSARKLGLTTTGHAGGIHNWQVSNTGQDFQGMLKEMGTGLLVTLGVILGGRSYITTVTPDGLIASQPSAHGTSVQEPAAGSIPSTGDSSEKTV